MLSLRDDILHVLKQKKTRASVIWSALRRAAFLLPTTWLQSKAHRQRPANLLTVTAGLQVGITYRCPEDRIAN